MRPLSFRARICDSCQVVELEGTGAICYTHACGMSSAFCSLALTTPDPPLVCGRFKLLNKGPWLPHGWLRQPSRHECRDGRHECPRHVSPANSMRWQGEGLPHQALENVESLGLASPASAHCQSARRMPSCPTSSKGLDQHGCCCRNHRGLQNQSC